MKSQESFDHDWSDIMPYMFRKLQVLVVLTYLTYFLFWAEAPLSLQVFPVFPVSSTVLLHVVLGLPLLSRPGGEFN
jgi:hypothetical protein